MSESEGLRGLDVMKHIDTKALLDNTTECLIHTTSVSFLH